MLYIIANKPFEGSRVERDDTDLLFPYKYTREWHVGEELPRNLPRVVTFQADGDELEAILRGLKKE